MVRYTIDNKGYTGSKLSYTSTASTSLTSTTLNTQTITWDSLVTATRHTTSIDTIPGTTSTISVDATHTYKGYAVTETGTTSGRKDNYMTVYVSRNSELYTEPGWDHFERNYKYTENFTFFVTSTTGLAAKFTAKNMFVNYDTLTSTWTYSERRTTGSGGPGGSSTWTYSESSSSSKTYTEKRTHTSANANSSIIVSANAANTLSASYVGPANFTSLPVTLTRSKVYGDPNGVTYGTGGHLNAAPRCALYKNSTVQSPFYGVSPQFISTYNKLFSSVTYIGTISESFTTKKTTIVEVS